MFEGTSRSFRFISQNSDRSFNATAPGLWLTMSACRSSPERRGGNAAGPFSYVGLLSANGRLSIPRRIRSKKLLKEVQIRRACQNAKAV